MDRHNSLSVSDPRYTLHIDQTRKETAQRLGTLGPLWESRSDLYSRNGVLVYKQLIRPMMNYACLAWRSAARTHLRMMQVLHSKCFRLTTGALRYVTSSSRGSGCSTIRRPYYRPECEL